MNEPDFPEHYPDNAILLGPNSSWADDSYIRIGSAIKRSKLHRGERYSYAGGMLVPNKLGWLLCVQDYTGPDYVAPEEPETPKPQIILAMPLIGAKLSFARGRERYEIRGYVDDQVVLRKSTVTYVLEPAKRLVSRCGWEVIDEYGDEA